MSCEWTDEQTGRIVRRLTGNPSGASLEYFRIPKHLPDGRVLARRHGTETDPSRLIAIDAASGDIEEMPLAKSQSVGMNPQTGCLWYRSVDGDQLCRWNWPQEEPEELARLPEEFPRGIVISCDERTAIAPHFEQPPSNEYPMPTVLAEPDQFWRWAARPRRGELLACDLASQEISRVVALEGLLPIHHDASPTDPTLLKFAHDDYDAFCQRIWTVRTDGSQLRPIRLQERGELITHEFWWPDGQFIAYKYQDRRRDETVHALPWAEYSPVPTQFGLAGLDGREVYLSDPLNSYHSHIFVSPDGRLLCGEGTDGHSFIHAAVFSPRDTKVDFVPLATIHTPYTPLGGQKVNAAFSSDGAWLLFNDTIEGAMQICCVQVDL